VILAERLAEDLLGACIAAVPSVQAPGHDQAGACRDRGKQQHCDEAREGLRHGRSAESARQLVPGALAPELR